MKDGEEQFDLRAGFDDWLVVQRDLAEAMYEGNPSDPGPTLAEGYQHLIRLMSSASLMYMEMDDPVNPRFYRDTDDIRKLTLDNPDSYYLRARVSPDRAYRISGNLGNSIYNSFSVETAHIAASSHVVLVQTELEEFADDDGNFEIWLGGDARDQNWIPLDADAHTVFVRQTFKSMDGRRPTECHIDRIGEGSAPQPDAAQTARRMRECAAFARWWCGRAYAIGKAYMEIPNQFRGVGRKARDPGGDRSIDYMGGSWRLADDEAMVITIKATSTYLYWGFHLANQWAETLDYRYHKIGLNNFQAVSNTDGSWTIILSNRDPGVPNWISTQGRAEGIMTMRWLKAAVEPPYPDVAVVKVATLSAAS